MAANAAGVKWSSEECGRIFLPPDEGKQPGILARLFGGG
jgi:hypothetical protein